MILDSLEQLEYLRYTREFDFSDFIRNKTFLITGSGGMTGSSLMKWILYLNCTHRTNATIFASTRNPERVPSYIEQDDRVIMCEFGKEEDMIGDSKIDYIIHAAAPTERKFFMNYPAETFQVIVDATKKMLQLCRDKKASFILLSSVEVYGALDLEKPIDESRVGAIDSLNVRNGYPLGKKGAEFLAYAYGAEYGCDIKVVRISAIQGLYQAYNEQRIFNEVARCILENRNLVMKSDGKSKKSIVYTLDAVSGIFTVLFKGEKGEVYNITNPDTFMSMTELVEKLFKRFNPKLRIEYDIESEKSTGYLPHLSIVQNTEKISKLGWKPITELEEIYEIDFKRWKSQNT